MNCSIHHTQKAIKRML